LLSLNPKLPSFGFKDHKEKLDKNTDVIMFFSPSFRGLLSTVWTFSNAALMMFYCSFLKAT
jgi:hypothetical protein